MANIVESFKFEGWQITSSSNGAFLLSYERGLISEDGACIVISQEVFNEAKKGELSLTALFEKYSLHNCKKLFTMTMPTVYPKPVNTPDKHHGHAYFVTRENGHYYFQYIKSRGVGDRKFEITEEIFEYAKNNDVGVYDIIEKYNLYHLDIPENDVK